MRSGPEVLFDITRLVTRFSRRTPNGIDRVDVEFAKHFFADGGDDAAGLIWTPFGAPRIGRRGSRAIVNSLLAHWREVGVPREDAPVRDARPAADARERPSGKSVIYLNVSQFPIWNRLYAGWLRRQIGWKPVFFIHDLISLAHPEYFPPAELPRHRARLETVAALAAGVIVSSPAVHDDLSGHFRRQGWKLPAVCVAPLGVPAIFHGARRKLSPPPDRPFFVICGTIEPRKNHWLLLNVWRELIRRDPSHAPTLVIAGRRGWESENTFALMDRSQELAPYVREASNLSTPELCDLLDRAQALLMPSFAEGYGLPVHEALARGTPVIASDLPVFRTIESPLLRLISPIDGLGWAEEIAKRSREPAPSEANRAGRNCEATWERHFKIVGEFLSSL